MCEIIYENSEHTVSPQASTWSPTKLPSSVLHPCSEWAFRSRWKWNLLNEMVIELGRRKTKWFSELYLSNELFHCNWLWDEGPTKACCSEYLMAFETHNPTAEPQNHSATVGHQHFPGFCSLLLFEVLLIKPVSSHSARRQNIHRLVLEMLRGGPVSGCDSIGRTCHGAKSFWFWLAVVSNHFALLVSYPIVTSLVVDFRQRTYLSYQSAMFLLCTLPILLSCHLI